MIIYIIIFAISLLGVREAELRYDDWSQRIIYSLIAVLPPIILAGFRDSTIGVDTEVYILPIFERLVSSGESLTEFLESNEDLELLYLILNFVVAQLTDQSCILLLCIHILIIIPLYVTAMKWRESLSPLLFMFVFYMIFYQDTLSIVRQSIALSFSLLAFTYLQEKKIQKYIILSLIALGFHNTALIALVYPMVFFFIRKYPLRQYYYYYIGASVLFIILILNFENFIIWTIDNDFVNIKYLKYTSALDTFEPILGVTNVIVKILTIIYILYIIYLYIPDVMLKFFFVMAFLDFVFSLCALIVQPLDRISFYFRLMSCISIPYMVKNYPIKQGVREYQVPIEYFWGIMLFIYWFYVYMVGNYGDTANYQFV